MNNHSLFLVAELVVVVWRRGRSSKAVFEKLLNLWIYKIGDANRIWI